MQLLTIVVKSVGKTVKGLRILMKLELIKNIINIDHSLMQNELLNLRGGYGSEKVS